MKKCIAVIICFVMALTYANAQFSLTLLGGMNLAKVTETKDITDVDNRLGYHIGALPEIMLGENIAIGLEAQYTTKGFKDVTDDAEFKINYLDLIPQVNLTLTKFLKLGAGLQYGLKVDELTKDMDDDWANTTKNAIFKKEDSGIRLKATLQFTSSLSVYGAYNIGLSKIGVDNDVKNQNIQVGIGLKLI